MSGGNKICRAAAYLNQAVELTGKKLALFPSQLTASVRLFVERKIYS